MKKRYFRTVSHRSRQEPNKDAQTGSGRIAKERWMMIVNVWKMVDVEDMEAGAEIGSLSGSLGG